MSQFAAMSLSILFYYSMSLISSLVNGIIFMSISLLVLEFLLLRDLSEIWKVEIPPSEFCLVSGDLGDLVMPNVAGMSLMKSYWMLQGGMKKKTSLGLNKLSSKYGNRIALTFYI